MFSEKWHKPFPIFGVMHVLALLVLLACVALLIVFRKKFPAGGRADKLVRIGGGALMVVLEIGFLIWSGIRGEYLPLIPLELCSIMLWCTAVASVFRLYRVFRVLFFWAMLGGILPFFIVTIDYGFPHYRFLHYFGVHMLIVLLNFYPIVTGKISLRYRDVLLSCLVLLALGGIVYPINAALNANFMFLRFLPGPLRALSDKLGPMYLAPFALVICTGLHAVFGGYVLCRKMAERTVRRREAQQKPQGSTDGCA